MATRTLFTYECDQCGHTETHDTGRNGHENGWLQLLENGGQEEVYCSYRCTIMAMFDKIAQHVPEHTHDGE